MNVIVQALEWIQFIGILCILLWLYSGGAIMLGDISRKYESGNHGPGTIVNNPQDPGGKSYGSFQFALKTGTLDLYIQNSKYKSKFKGLQLGSAQFDAVWKQLAVTDTVSFLEDQQAFIKKTHYDPVRLEADKYKWPHNTAINEAIFSLSVQHGKAIKILQSVNRKLGHSPTDLINLLYDAREAYVKTLKLPAPLLKALLNRYKRERQDVLALLNKP